VERVARDRRARRERREEVVRIVGGGLWWVGSFGEGADVFIVRSVGFILFVSLSLSRETYAQKLSCEIN